jgi:hypothetical protein
MKKFIYVVLGVIFAGSITGCSHKPIYNVEHHAMPAEAKKLTSQEIGQRIRQAVAKRDWRCDETTPCVLICHHERRTHKAIVQIDYNRDFFSIHNVKTENLNYSAGTIHPKYNKWIKNMEKDIVRALSLPICQLD